MAKGNILPYQSDLVSEGDELLQNIDRYRDEYEEQKRLEDEAKEAKKEAGSKLTSALAILALTASMDPDTIDGLVLTPISESTGKQKVWERVRRAGSKKIDPAILLQKGVSADIIKEATVEGEGSEFWQLSETKADTLAKKILA